MRTTWILRTGALSALRLGLLLVSAVWVVMSSIIKTIREMSGMEMNVNVSFGHLQEFLSSWEMDVDFLTVKQHQINNLRNLLVAEMESCWDNIKDDTGAPALCLDHVENMKEVFQAWIELDELERLTQKVYEVRIWALRSDGECHCMEQIDIERREGIVLGDDKFSSEIRRYAHSQLDHPKWKEFYSGYDSRVIYRVWGHSEDHYLFDISSSGDPYSIPLTELLADYARWVGYNLIEHNRDIEPSEYVIEGVQARSLSRDEAYRLLKEFYSEETTAIYMHDLFEV